MWANNNDDVVVGDLVFLYERSAQYGSGLYASTRPRRTNRSGQRMLNGWCGETNNVSISADGAGIVTRECQDRVQVKRLHGEPLHVALANIGLAVDGDKLVLA